MAIFSEILWGWSEGGAAAPAGPQTSYSYCFFSAVMNVKYKSKTAWRRFDDLRMKNKSAAKPPLLEA